MITLADNVAYEWKHSKGLLVYSKKDIETDLWGYYDKKLLDYYPKPKEYQYIDDYPFEDSLIHAGGFQPNEWETVDESFRLTKSDNAKSPEAFQKEVEELTRKYNNPQPGNVWGEQPKL